MIVEDMGGRVPMTYVALDNKKVDFQFHMIHVEGKIKDQPIAILVDLGSIHSYLGPKMVERFQFLGSNVGKSLLVQLAIGEKRKINEKVKEYPMEINGLDTNVDCNIITLGSYDFLIGKDCLDEHHVVLDYYNKDFTFLDVEGNLRIVQGILRVVTIKDVSTLKLKKIFKKGCQVFVVHLEEEIVDTVPSVEDFAVLREFEYIFREILGFPPKGDIYFSINMIPREMPISKTPYRITTPKMKKL
jgi:hypothetical protein